MFQKKLKANRNCKMMVYGENGSGKLPFALLAKTALGKKKVAYLSTSNRAEFYRENPRYGGFHELVTRDISEVDSAVRWLAKQNDFGLVVVDDLTDLWYLRQGKYLRPDRLSHPDISKGDWLIIRREHTALLHALVNLPFHVACLCGAKSTYGWDERFAGYDMDTFRSDARIFDICLRMFRSDGVVFAECEVDRTGKAAPGEIVREPFIIQWVGKPVAEQRIGMLEPTFLGVIEEIKHAGGEAEGITLVYQGFIQSLPGSLKREITKAVDRAMEKATEQKAPVKA